MQINQTLLTLTITLIALTGCGHHAKDASAELSTETNNTVSYAVKSQQLQEQLAPKLQEHATATDIETMKQSAAHLATALPNPGLAVGDQAPDFDLPNANGENISLSQALQTGPVVLVFYRGNWCPFCNLHLHTLRSILPELNSYDANLIAITPQKPDESAKVLAEQGFPFEVLSDLDDSVMKAYHLFFEVDTELLAVYKKFDIDLEVSNGEGRTGLPVPATFVIDRKGIIQAAHADIDYKNRMEPADVLAAVKRISH